MARKYTVGMLVGTSGDTTLDAALSDMGMHREDAVNLYPVGRFCGNDCGSLLPAKTVYDDGLCGKCRDVNDALILAYQDNGESQRLIDRVERMFPGMTSGQILAFVANLLRQKEAYA